jgi:hypothetical protein
MLIIALAVALFVSLFPNQDLLFLFSIALAAAFALPLSAVKMIHSAVGLEYLKKATRSYGISAALFFIQYVDNIIPNAIFPSGDIFAWVGLFVLAIAGFYSAFVIEFVWKPDFRPPITLRLILLALILGAFDYLTITLARSFSPSFGKIILATGFILLTIPSVISSILSWWMDRKGMSEGLINLSIVFMLLPYIWAFMLFIVVVVMTLAGSFLMR